MMKSSDWIDSILEACPGLEPNWDGEESMAVKATAVRHCRSFMERDADFVDLVKYVYPSPAGNICVDWMHDGRKVSYEFGATQLALYYQSADRKEFFDSPIMCYDDKAFYLICQYLELAASGSSNAQCTLGTDSTVFPLPSPRGWGSSAVSCPVASNSGSR